MEVLWVIPTVSDSRYYGTAQGRRPATLAYMRQIAEALDELGYAGALLPTGKFCEDAWVTASTLVPFTQRLKFLVAARPGVMTPVVAARTAATFDRISAGRLLVNVVTGIGSTADLVADGLHPDHDTRYEVTDEFLTTWKALAHGETVHFTGKHLTVEGAALGFPMVSKPHPPLYFGGASAAGQRIAAKHADVYISYAEPLEQVAQHIDTVRRIAQDEYGRTLRFGLRAQILVRHTESEAWDAANELLRYVSDEAIEQARIKFEQSASVAQRRLAALHGSRRDNLVIGPNLWAGFGLVNTGSGTGFVGDPATIARRIQEYADLGITSFIFNSSPHYEEAFRVAELLFPLLPLEQRPAHYVGA